jgi:hypothetical protein
LRSREHRVEEDLHTICMRYASLLHTHELRCYVTRGQGGDHQLADRCVQACPGKGLADLVCVLDHGSLAYVVGELEAAADVVAHGHPGFRTGRR